VRLTVSTTDSDDLREYHVSLGGAQRGGLLIQHGYLSTDGYELADEVERIVAKLREMIEAYVCTWGFIGIELQYPPQPDAQQG
jgi:prophage maintenance system killer protein